MSKIVTKLNMLGMHNMATQFSQLELMIDIDNMFENNQELLQKCIVDKEYINSEEFMEIIASQIYLEEDNPFKIILRIQFACIVFGGLAKTVYIVKNVQRLTYNSIETSQMLEWLSNNSPLYEHDKLKKCERVINKVEHDFSIIKQYRRLNKYKAGLTGMSDGEVELYMYMINFIRGILTEMSIEKFKRIENMIDRNEEQLLDII